MKGSRDVQVTVWIDGGEPVRFLLHEDEVRSFEGTSAIKIRLARGKVAEITVNDKDMGKPGKAKAPYSATFRPESFRGEEASPSPTTSPKKKRP
jgi:hypothetical protein